MATSSKTRNATWMVVLLLVLTGCTGSGTPTVARHANSRSTVATTSIAPRVFTAVDGGAPLRAEPCLVGLPSAWREAIANGKLWSTSGGGNGPTPDVPGPGGDGALFSRAPDGLSDIVLAGRGQQTVSTIGTKPEGYAWSASNDRWIAFVGGNGPGISDFNHWTMWLWDSRTGVLRDIARNPVDAHNRALPGYYVVPVLTDKYLYWIQAAPDVHHLSDSGAGSEVVQYNLATGRKRVVYDGVAAAVRPYQGLVLFTAVPAGPKRGHIVASNGNRNMVVRAVDERTGKEVPAPKGVTAGPDDAFQMVTEGDLIVWSRWQGGVAAWRPSWGRTVLLTADNGGSGGLKDLVGSDALGLYRQFLVFRAADRPWVLDLRTDSIAPLTAHLGREAFGGGHYLTIWQDNQPQTLKAGYTAYLIDLAKLPDLPGCRAR